MAAGPGGVRGVPVGSAGLASAAAGPGSAVAGLASVLAGLACPLGAPEPALPRVRGGEGRGSTRGGRQGVVTERHGASAARCHSRGSMEWKMGRKRGKRGKRGKRAFVEGNFKGEQCFR